MSHTHGITNNQPPQLTVVATERTAPVKSTTLTSATAATTAAQTSAITTSLSGAGTQLSNANTDDVRTDKVAALKSAIDSGTYNVPASAVADKLITSLLE